MKYFIFQQREPRGRKYRESLQILLSSGTPYHRLRTPACKSCRLLESPAGAAPAVYKGCNAQGKGHFGFVTYDRVPCKSLRPRHLREMPPPPQCSLSRGGKIKWRYMCLNVYSFTATLQAYQAPKLQFIWLCSLLPWNRGRPRRSWAATHPRDHMSIAWLKGSPAQNNYSVSQIFKILFCIRKSTSIEKFDSELLKKSLHINVRGIYSIVQDIPHKLNKNFCLRHT